MHWRHWNDSSLFGITGFTESFGGTALTPGLSQRLVAVASRRQLHLSHPAQVMGGCCQWPYWHYRIYWSYMIYCSHRPYWSHKIHRSFRIYRSYRIYWSHRTESTGVAGPTVVTGSTGVTGFTGVTRPIEAVGYQVLLQRPRRQGRQEKPGQLVRRVVLIM